MIYACLLLATAASALDPLIAEICARSPTVASLAQDWCSETVPVCQWQGVQCYTADGIDIELEVTLQNVPLVLDLPISSLAQTKLQSLVMSNCDVGGSLASIELSSTLKRLDLSSNPRLRDFVTVPTFASLFGLHLVGCGLASDISAVLCSGQQAMMVRLELAHNELVGDLSACVGGSGVWDSMGVFNVSSNKLSGRAPVPPNSIVFDVSENQFTALEEVFPAKRTIDLGEAGVREVFEMKKCITGGLRSVWTDAVPSCKKN